MCPIYPSKRRLTFASIATINAWGDLPLIHPSRDGVHLTLCPSWFRLFWSHFKPTWHQEVTMGPDTPNMPGSVQIPAANWQNWRYHERCYLFFPRVVFFCLSGSRILAVQQRKIQDILSKTTVSQTGLCPNSSKIALNDTRMYILKRKGNELDEGQCYSETKHWNNKKCEAAAETSRPLRVLSELHLNQLTIYPR